MNILLVSEPGENGVFRYVESLALHLLAQPGLAVHLAYSDRRGSDRLDRLVETVERHGGRTLNLRVGNAPEPADLRALLALRAFVRRVRPDVIHSHSSKAGVLARALPLTGAAWSARFVHHAHAYLGMRPRRGRMDTLYDLVEHVLGRRSTSVATSGDEHRYALEKLRLPPRRTRQVSNGTDTARFTPADPAGKRELRARLGLPADAPVLGAMSRCSAQKDPLTLYRALAVVRTLRPDLVLFHIGAGELDPEIDDYVRQHGLEKNVVRRPRIAEPVEFYQAVDGFILTSRYEGLSLALLEALSCDLPLILSEAPGNGDVLTQPLNRLWSAPVGRADAFAEAIGAWARSLNAPALPPCNHREIALERFDERDCFRRVRRLYARLVEPAPRARLRLRAASPS